MNNEATRPAFLPASYRVMGKEIPFVAYVERHGCAGYSLTDNGFKVDIRHWVKKGKFVIKTSVQAKDSDRFLPTPIKGEGATFTEALDAMIATLNEHTQKIRA